MCWKSVYVPVKEIAKKDIPVFKILTGTLLSVYNDFEYSLNKTYHTTIGEIKKDGFDYKIYEGFHSYDDKEVKTFSNNFKILIYCYPSIIRPITHLDAFYLQYLYSDSRIPSKHYCKVKGIIPKGACYYKNEYGEYVSDSIMLNKIVEEYGGSDKIKVKL